MNSYFGEAGRCGTQVSTYCWRQGGKKPESFRAATSLGKHLIPFRSRVLEDLYLSVFHIPKLKKRCFSQPSQQSFEKPFYTETVNLQIFLVISLRLFSDLLDRSSWGFQLLRISSAVAS